MLGISVRDHWPGNMGHVNTMTIFLYLLKGNNLAHCVILMIICFSLTNVIRRYADKESNKFNGIVDGVQTVEAVQVSPNSMISFQSAPRQTRR
jgi:hypothetical protein